jgi:surface protein
MKTSETYPSKTTTATATATTASTANTNNTNNTSTNAPDDYFKVEVPSSIASAANTATISNTPSSASSSSDALPRRYVQSSMDKFLSKRAGKTASATEPPRVVTPDTSPRKEPGHQGKVSSTRTPGQDVARPGAFHVSVEAGSSDAPTGERGYNKDEFRRQRPGQSASATAPSTSAPSDVAATRDWRSSRDAYDRKVAAETAPASATAPSTSVPSDAPATRDWRSSRDEYDRKVAGETASASATAPSSSVPSDATATRERGYGLGGIQGKFSSTPDQDVLRPRAFHDGGVEAGSSDAPTGEWGYNKDEFRRQRPGQTASATTPSSLATPDAPTRERGYELDGFQGNLPSSATEDQEPDEHYSERGAFRVGETPMWSLTETDNAERVTTLSTVPEIHQLWENTQGEYLAEANLVVEPELVVAEPLEEPKALWRQPKVRRRAMFVFLLVVGMLVGVGVGVGFGVKGRVSTVLFKTSCELRGAVSGYVTDNSEDSTVASTYGWPIGNWDVSEIRDFSFLFSADGSIFLNCNPAAANFNEDIDLSDNRSNPAIANFNENISGWTMSNATNMTSMFAGARYFDQPIGNWTVSNVQDISFMFYNAASFDQPLDDWNVSRVTDMSFAFYNASSFNQTLVSWEVSSVRDLSFMFAYATSLDQSFYSSWNVSDEADIRGIFTGADGTFEVQVQVQYDNAPRETGWTLRDSNGTLISSQAPGSFTTQNSTVTNTTYVALGTYTFEMTDTGGNGICCGTGSRFSVVVNGETVVSNDGRFRGNVTETFDVRAPTPSPRLVFETTDELREAVDSYLADSSTNALVARTYGSPIGVWDVSKIQDFSFLFSADEFADIDRFNPAIANFNDDISGWTMSSATNMTSMFIGATSFNQPIGNWDVSSAQDMSFMFAGATSFNQPIGNWVVSSAQDISYIFFRAASFNQPLAEWNVSSVTSMSFMFYEATAFNQPLADWNVWNVTTMVGMFGFAASFNQPIGNWNVSNVLDMSFMFFGATNFSQSLAGWTVQDETDLTNIFGNSGCPVADGENKTCFSFM